MKNLQQSEVSILNNSEHFVGDQCADLFSIGNGISNKLVNFTKIKLAKLMYKMCTA